jgi:ABC-2 type transport system permease protein
MSVEVARTEASRAARRSERAPSGGWRTIAAKELSDHLSSVRFFVLLFVVGITAIIPLWFATNTISGVAAQASGAKFLFLALFTLPAQDAAGIVTAFFVAFFAPLVGIAFGFDAVNSERSQGTLSRLLAQPIHRDDVINGKFAAGLAVIAMMLTTLVVLMAGFAIIRLGIIPSVEEVFRVVAWVLATILYAGFWLAFGLLLSVALRSAASAALLGFGTWIGVFLFGNILLPILARVFFPIDATGSVAAQYGAQGMQSLFLRISPATLYTDIAAAILDPTVNRVLLPGSIGEATSANDVLPTLLSFDQSLLVVWPQIVILVAMTIAVFALGYIAFLRQEVRA